MNAVSPPEKSAYIKEANFPGLYQSADSASQSAQQYYFLLQKLNIASLVLGSVSAALVVAVPAEITTWMYVALAVFLFASIFLHGLSRVLRYDKVWFDCRAIAESAKTASWRFMMKTAPFEGDDEVAIRSFLETLKKIREAKSLSEQKYLTKNLDLDSQAVSEFMINTRHMNLKQRQGLYLKSRLQDQAAWYLQKAQINSKKEFFWFWTIVVIQILAIVFAIIQVALEGLPINIIPLLMTCAASGVAWGQIRRYSELAQTYSLSAQELKEQEALATDAIEENVFLSFVESVEETISREHTMWHARRVY